MAAPYIFTMCLFLPATKMAQKAWGSCSLFYTLETASVCVHYILRVEECSALERSFIIGRYYK